ncbi:MAG TPA: peptidoglycan-binding protein [Pyrinomonadaceae bacterium]|nr:peptidoglycan-binding protein [Pyrinomonadaceae bacterium]
MRVLRKGMGGPDVKQWQEFLLRQGFAIGTADGSFGDRTFQATADFQQRNGLSSDGVVGPGTLAKAKELGFVEPETTVGGGSSAGRPTSVSSGSLTEQALAQIMPNLKADKRAAYFPFLTSAMAEFEINTPARQAAFLAQLAHESAEFRFMEEIWGPTPAQKRYEGRRDLGNTQPGDGFRFKGRGPIQVTGRSNYRRYGDMLGVDLISNPQLAATPEVGFRIAGLYWRTNGINAMADRQDIVAVTRAINGGTNGLEDRKKYYERAKRVLGVSAGTRSIGGGGATRGLDDEAPAEKVLSRGLDASGETTPTAAERNASESAAAAGGTGGGETRAAATASASGAAKGGAKAAPKKPAKKSAAKKSVAKKSTAKKSAAKKSSAKKSSAKKSTVKKSSAKKSSAKKSAAKKSATKKSVASKGSKSAAKKGAAAKKSSGKSASKKGGKAVKGRSRRR